MKKFLILATMVALFFSAPAFAEEIVVSGIGKALITPDIATTRAESMRMAKREAVVAAINKVNGPTSSNDPKVQAAIDNIAVQIGDEMIADQSSSKDAANNFVTKITLRMDDLFFRQQIQAQGIASTVSRSFPIMVVMDEFFTTATDHTKPLREVIEFSSDKTKTFAASASESASASDSDSSSTKVNYDNQASNNYNADGSMKASSSGSVRANVYGEGSVAASGSRSAAASYSASGASSSHEKGSLDAQSASSSSSASSSDAHVFDQQKDVLNYKKLVEYQPQNVGPDKQNYTYTALLREATKYDLNLLDNDLFKSKYFTGKPLTMAEMQNSPELARYVEAARDNKADYFMVGNTIILDNGKNETIGAFVCDGLVTIKSYSTEDGSVLASDTRSESATGSSPDQCRVNVANKLAGFVGSNVGSTIQNYWRQRETYGREYNLLLVSLLGDLSEDDKDSFAEAVESIQGLQSKVIERKSTRGEYEVSITYKGDRSISREVGSALKKVEGFEKAGRKVKGTTLRVCLEGPCPEKI